MTSEISSTGDLAAAAVQAAEHVQLFEPKFDFTIRWAPDYDSLFRGDDLAETDPDALVDRAFRRGRVLLQSAGGTGKTSILYRLLRSAISQGILPFFVDLRRWRPEMFVSWAEFRDSEPLRLQLLFDWLTVPEGVVEGALDTAEADHRILLLVDGLNEVPSSVGDSIIQTLDAFARRHPRAGVVATDRLVRRPLHDPHWALATIAPIEGRSGLDGMAYFRNLALAQGSTSMSSAEVQREYLLHHGGFDDADLADVAPAAFALYANAQSRTFPTAELRRLVGAELLARLVSAGVVLVDGDLANFRHHLIHDYLASIQLVHDRELWSARGFDVITMTASSFDVLAMALEQLPNSNDADLLLRRIYDWSFYGAAYALATCRGRNSTSVSEQMEIALLAMLTERRWDPFRATAQQVTDALTLFPSGLAESFLDAPDLESVFDIVLDLIKRDSELWEWAELFTRPIDSPADDSSLEVLERSDSLMGWTMANVIKRTSLTRSQLSRLAGLLESADETVRWRTAHALGAYPDRLSIDALFNAFDDSYSWVVYGSIRSLVEIAGRSPEFRSEVISRLREEVERRADQSIERQMSRVVILTAPPEGWADEVGPILEDLWAAADTEERQDHWRRVAYELRRNQEERDDRVA